MTPWVGQLRTLARSGSRSASMLDATSGSNLSRDRFGECCLHELRRIGIGIRGVSSGKNGVLSGSMGSGSTTSGRWAGSRSFGSRALAADCERNHSTCETSNSSSSSARRQDIATHINDDGGGGGNNNASSSGHSPHIMPISVRRLVGAIATTDFKTDHLRYKSPGDTLQAMNLASISDHIRNPSKSFALEKDRQAEAAAPSSRIYVVKPRAADFAPASTERSHSMNLVTISDHIHNPYSYSLRLRAFHSHPYSSSSIVLETAEKPDSDQGPAGASSEGTAQATTVTPANLTRVSEREREITDVYIRPNPMIYNFAGVAPDSKASRLSDASKENIWFLHQQNPEEWTVDRLASEYKIRKQRVHAILWLKDIQKKMEEEAAAPLDTEIEKAFEKIQGSFTKADAERHVKIIYTEPKFEVVEEDWDEDDDVNKRNQAVPTVEELSAREEEMLVAEFERRMEFNKKQMEGMIKANKMDRKRPKEGWSYVIEDIGKNAKRGKGGGKRFISEPDGTHRTLNELEKMFLQRETSRPRRRPTSR